MTTRHLVLLFAWGTGVLIACAVVILLWAWSVPEIEGADGRLVADSARIQTRTLVVLLVGFVVALAGGGVIVRRNGSARARRAVR